MYSMTISFGPSGTMWALLFKTKEAGEAAWTQLALSKAGGSMLNVIDDFGQNIAVEIDGVHGAVLENLEESKLGHIERALHQTRMQNQAQKMAESDASLRQYGRQGPAILTPGIGNGSFPPRQ